MLNKQPLFIWFQNQNKKIKRAIVLIFVAISFFLLFMLIKFLLTNNLAWLEGRWYNQDEKLKLKTENRHYTTWDVTENGIKIIDNGRVTVDSTTKNIFLVNDNATTKVHVTKLNRHQLKLKLIYHKKVAKTMTLQKSKH
ncbi:hypothetical protein [Enterococcus xiangfangensis]|uniref:hypothetical protein n=1 Tax=Enterococcus xiangfangensis TaxID=1296537 RepID=UPI0010F68315|nr:hypothetical protein [Enterococcus xiangfangensis]MBM7712213.1 hypothetical protein [Enterococcus xiangfangensis]